MKTVTYETTVEVNGKDYFVSGELELELIDDGIGAYEYWGAKGNDVNWTWDVSDYTYDVVDEDGNTIKDKVLLAQILTEYEHKAFAYASTIEVEDDDEPVDDSESY